MKVLFVRSGNHGPDPITQNQGDSLIEAGCEIEYFDISGSGIFGYLKNSIRFRRTVRRVKPDIIHAHYAYSGLLASISFAGKPVITSLMGSDVNDASHLSLLLIGIFIRFFWSATIVKTKKTANKIQFKKVYIIPNGVDFEVFKPVDQSSAQSGLGWSADVYNILFPADPARPEKNFNLCQKAIDILKNTTPGIQLHFLVGIHPSEVFIYYNAADVLLLTSISEGSPNVIKEAMATNCPVVATDVGDVSEIIQNTDGCYVTSFSPVEIAGKLKIILERKIRTNGRENIRHLESKIIASEITGVYNTILNTQV